MKRMNIFDSNLNYVCFTVFRFCEEQITEQVLAKYGNTVSRMQMFSTFYEPDRSYPFMKGKTAYYPLTIIFKNGTWETVWIQWDISDIPEKYAQGRPYNVGINGEKTVLKICESVDPDFQQQIEGKELCYIQNKNMISGVGLRFKRDHILLELITKYSAWFQKELIKQTNVLFEKYTGYKLNNRWEIVIYLEDEIVRYEGKNYMKAWLNSFCACQMEICITWVEDISPSDYIEEGEITFDLSEEAPHFQPTSFERIKKFIEIRGVDIV